MTEKDGDKFLRELAEKALKAERLQRQVEALLCNEPETLEDWVEQEKN